jgi:multidrug efflux pump
VTGVGSVQVFGSEYAMRIWLDPSALNNYGLTVADVSAAVEAQNAQVTAGQLGGLPAVEGQQLNATVTAQTLLTSVEEFRNILVKSMPDGSRVRLGDVARVELGGGAVQIDTFYDGEPAAGLGINLAPGANSLGVTQAVKARLQELRPYFPEGVEIRYPYQTAPFVEASIDAVVQTIIEAIALVVLVMLLFLQSWRATLIPAIAIPVVLLGTFAIMAAFGFSINMLTLFGGGKRRAGDARGRARPDGGNTKVHGADRQCPGGHRCGAFCCLYSDGLLSRVHRGDLPAVFPEYCRGYGSFGAGRSDPEPHAVWPAAETYS